MKTISLKREYKAGYKNGLKHHLIEPLIETFKKRNEIAANNSNEYDEPGVKAYWKGYYDGMNGVIKLEIKARELRRDEIIQIGDLHSYSGGGFSPLLNVDSIGQKVEEFSSNRKFYRPIETIQVAI